MHCFSLHARFDDLPNLEFLDLSSNRLVGPVPTFINSENLQIIDLSRNAFSGSPADSWQRLVKLRQLFLQHNRLVSPMLNVAYSPVITDLDLSNVSQPTL